MRIIPPNIHAVMDYIMGAILIASPWLFNYYSGGMETSVPVITGIVSLVFTLITSFKYSLLNIIPVQFHLIMDFIMGLFLMISPWVTGFYTAVFLPHLIFGCLQIFGSITTKLR